MVNASSANITTATAASDLRLALPLHCLAQLTLRLLLEAQGSTVRNRLQALTGKQLHGPSAQFRNFSPQAPTFALLD